MGEVRRSLEGGSRARRSRAGRFTAIVVVLLLTWLAIWWLVGRTAVER
jgi:hypothetical protein